MRRAQSPLLSFVFVLLLLALPGRGQVLPSKSFEAAVTLIRDSTEAAQRTLYARPPNPRQALRMIDAVLRLYPQQIGWQNVTDTANGKPPVTYWDRHPWELYSLRARVRDALGDLRGAVADLDRAIEYTSVGDQNLEVPNLWSHKDFYERRLDLKLRLNDPAAACADVAALWQYDTTVATRLGWPRRLRCALPTHKLVVTMEDQARAQQAGLDSLRRVEKLLAAGRYATARRIGDQLAAGKMGGFVHYRTFNPTHYSNYWRGAVFELRARARQGLGDYRGALADLDTAMRLNASVPYASERYSPGWRVPLVQRGQLKIRHLDDRAGGCADLAEAYRSDTTTTRPTHPKWCNCPLPARGPFGQAEKAEARTALNDSIRQANERLAVRDYAAVLRLTTPLIRLGQAGRFVGVIDDEKRRADVRVLRATALEGLGDYRGAVAQLDTALLEHVYESRKCLVQRGIIKVEHLSDPSGCDDLSTAYRQGYRSRNGNWHGCRIPERQLGYRVGEVFEELTEVTPQVGYCTQGSRGLMLGVLLSPGEFEEAWGPSLGVDVLFAPLVVAPRLAVEGAVGNPFGPTVRLDLALYARDGITDLRLTPQIGLTVAALLNAYVGYALPLTGQRQPFIAPVRFALTFNFLEVFMKIGG